MNFVAEEDSLFLRIGARELLAVIENDAKVATLLLRTVAGHLNSAANRVRAVRNYAEERGVDFSDLEVYQQRSS